MVMLDAMLTTDPTCTNKAAAETHLGVLLTKQQVAKVVQAAGMAATAIRIHPKEAASAVIAMMLQQADTVMLVTVFLKARWGITGTHRLQVGVVLAK